MNISITLAMALAAQSADPPVDAAMPPETPAAAPDARGDDVPVNPVELDYSFSLRPQHLPIRKALKKYFVGKGLSIGSQDVAVAAVSDAPEYHFLQTPLRRAMASSLKGHSMVGRIHALIPAAEVETPTVDELIRMADDAGAEVLMVATISESDGPHAPTVRVQVFLPSGRQVGDVPAPDAIAVRSVETYRQYIRSEYPVSQDQPHSWKVRKVPILGSLVADKLSARDVLCVAATAAEHHTTHEQLAPQVARSLAQSVDGAPSAPEVRVLDSLPATATLPDAVAAMGPAGCTAVMWAHMDPTPDGSVTETEIRVATAKQPVVLAATTQRLVVNSYSSATDEQWAAFRRKAVKPVLAALVTTYTQDGAKMDTSREDALTLERNGKMMALADLWDFQAEVGTGVAAAETPDRNASFKRALTILQVAALALPMLGCVPTAAACTVPSLPYILLALSTGSFNSATLASIAVSAAVGGILGGLAGALAMGVVQSAAIIVRILMGTTSSPSTMPSKEVLRLAKVHNSKLAASLGIDPMDAGDDYFPMPEDLEITRK